MALSFDHVPERLGLRPERHPTGVVCRLRYAHRYRADGDLLARSQFDDVLDARLTSNQGSGSARRNDGHVTSELLQRRQIEMVVVEMRDQDRIDATEGTGVDLDRAAEVGDAVPQQRIGEEADAGNVDESRGVSDVPDGGAVRSVHSAILRPEV